jgi:hypothetical protein
MQMAMVLTAQKPTQRERIGEFLEGLPGSTKSVACVERNAQELGRPESFLGRLLARVVHPQWSEQVGRTERTSRRANSLRESDQPILLRDGKAVHKGKGLTEVRSL